MWSEKRDSGVLETCVSPFVGKNKPKTMHNVVLCDQSDVLTGLRSLTIESVLCQKISLINHTSQQKVFRIRKTKLREKRVAFIETRSCVKNGSLLSKRVLA